MKTITLIVLVFAALTSTAQQPLTTTWKVAKEPMEYSQIQNTTGGWSNLNKSKLGLVTYNFGEGKEDSVRAYESHKLRNIIDAIQLMDLKGWELISIQSYGDPTSLTTTANFKRNLKTKIQ